MAVVDILFRKKFCPHRIKGFTPNRHCWRFALLPFFLWFLTACELTDSPPPGENTPVPTATLPSLALAVDVKDDAIIVPIAIDPPSFNAYLNDTGFEALIGELVYGALAEIGPDGTYYAELAESLPTLANGGLSEDGLAVTWKLRPDIKWSDGQPFTSEDVRFTWQALRDSGVWAPGFDLIEEIETPDDLTAVVKYRQYYPDYLLQFGGNGTGVLPAHHCGPTDQMLLWDCNFEPVSTGPYMLGEWVPDVRLTFTPNPNYYIPERPLASQLVLEIDQNPERRGRSLERGNVHLDLWPEESEISRMQDSGTVTVFWTNPARFVLRLVLNLSDPAANANPDIPHPALSNPQVRKAIYHAVDVAYLNAEAFNNRGVPVETELFQLGCDIPPFHDYNLGLAQALLDDAGWKIVDTEAEFPIRECQNCGTAKDGTPLELDSYTYLEFGDSMENAHQMLEQMMLEAGIKLNRHSIEGGKLWNTWENEGIEIRGNFDMNVWDDGYFGVDPTLYMADMFDARSIPTRDNPVAGLNVSRYRNPELTDLFNALYTPIPDNRRRALLCELALTLYQDMPHIPLIAFPDVYAISIDIEGVRPHIYDTVTWNAGDWKLVRPTID